MESRHADHVLGYGRVVREGFLTEMGQEAFISGSPTSRISSLVIPQDQGSILKKPRIEASDLFSEASRHSESGHLGWGLGTIF